MVHIKKIDEMNSVGIDGYSDRGDGSLKRLSDVYSLISDRREDILSLLDICYKRGRRASVGKVICSDRKNSKVVSGSQGPILKYKDGETFAFTEDMDGNFRVYVSRNENDMCYTVLFSVNSQSGEIVIPDYIFVNVQQNLGGGDAIGIDGGAVPVSEIALKLEKFIESLDEIIDGLIG